MPHSYFRFKQFIIRQEKAAMKVCTDSCLFGAWAAETILYKNAVTHILDIGAGTGLLSLMLAQKNAHSLIDAVEADDSSSKQAEENVDQSPWKENINIYNERIHDFYPGNHYDVIISNPPFYEDDLLSAKPAKNLARHHTGLTLEELINAVIRLLSDDGCFAVLLPYHRMNEFQMMANEAGLFLHKKVLVRQTPKHTYFRSMCMFSKERTDVLQDEIIIKDEHNQYTPAFTALLKDYYLFL